MLETILPSHLCSISRVIRTFRKSGTFVMIKVADMVDIQFCQLFCLREKANKVELNGGLYKRHTRSGTKLAAKCRVDQHHFKNEKNVERVRQFLLFGLFPLFYQKISFKRSRSVSSKKIFHGTFCRDKRYAPYLTFLDLYTPMTIFFS